MLKDKMVLFTYYDFDFKRDFLLKEIDRILSNKLREYSDVNLDCLSIKDKVNLIDLTSLDKFGFFDSLAMDIHSALEVIENREIPFKSMRVSNIEKEHCYREGKKLNVNPAFRFDCEGLSQVFTCDDVSKKNLLLSYIELLDTKLIEIRNYYKKVLRKSQR